ncbi:MAG: SpoIIE family protein phosphatase [Gemmatimonadales bacterium]|nr:SpoIIE family protein phosphatase [Gemmatimonadales bacterium]
MAGQDPGWSPETPAADGIAFTPDGPRWFGPVPEEEGWWLETAPGSGAAATLTLVAHLFRGGRETSRLSAELATRYEEIDLLYTISEVLGHTVRLTEATATIVRAVSEVVGAARASIAVFDEPAGLLRTVAAQGFDGGRAADIPLDDPDSIAARVVREGEALVGVGEGDGTDGGRGYRGQAYMSVPIRYHPPGGESRCVGVINLTDRVSGGRFSASDLKLVAAAANQIGAAIELARLVAREREQQRLEDELQIAHDLQLSLLPAPASLQGDARVGVSCVPAEQVGGDFYTFNRLGLGLVGVMVGDVSSHGVGAALMMAAVMSAAGIHASAADTPNITLMALRGSLAAKLASADTYVTVFYGILDPVHRRLSWASAGHPHAFRVRATGDPERLDATAPPLGLGAAAEIGARVVEWAVDSDLLCLFTDGLLDAQNAEGERYGEGRLLAALGARRTLEPDRIVAEVMAEADAFSSDPGDDRTLLVLRL